MSSCHRYDEQYTITRLPSGTIRIAAFGEIEDFEGVSTIIGSFGDGNDWQISTSGQSARTISGGSGKDSLYYGGAGLAILNGNDGDDDLTIGGTPLSTSAPTAAPARTHCSTNPPPTCRFMATTATTPSRAEPATTAVSMAAGQRLDQGRGGQDSMFGGPGDDKLVVEIGDLALSETVDGGADEDQIVIAGDSSAQDLRVTMDSYHVVKISSYSGGSETGSVTLANLEAVMLSGGKGADNFSVAGELDLGGVTDVVIDMGSDISESGQVRDGNPDVANLTLSGSADEPELAPADTGIRGIWKDHPFTFTVLTGYAADGDEVNVHAGGGDDLIKVTFDPLQYGTYPQDGGPVDPNSVLQVYLTYLNGDRYGPTFSFEQVENLSIGEGQGETPPVNEPLVVDTAADESDGDYSAGDFSLREAIELANATAGADTIVFAAGLAGSTITLTSGELAIIDDLTITGLGADQLTISGDHASRILFIDNAARPPSPLR